MYKVWCKVSGGVTGTRETWLKKNGVEQEFETREEAETEAKRLNKTMNNAFAVADFHYKAVEI